MSAVASCNPKGFSRTSSECNAAVLFHFTPPWKGDAAMKFTPIKGLIRLVMVMMAVLIGLPFTKSFSFIAVCALLCIGWVFYWLVGSFFDVD